MVVLGVFGFLGIKCFYDKIVVSKFFINREATMQKKPIKEQSKEHSLKTDIGDKIISSGVKDGNEIVQMIYDTADISPYDD